jgi:hypothetical protein
MVSNKIVVNYEVIYRVESYNIDIKFTFSITRSIPRTRYCKN